MLKIRIEMRIFLIAISFFLFSKCQTAWFNSSDCKNRSRWDVKTLTDKDAEKINFTPVETTISELLNIIPEKTIEFSTPRFGVEFTTCRVRCYIKKFKEKKDGDIHLEITDIDDNTKIMLAEIPDPECGVAQESIYIKKFIDGQKRIESFLNESGEISSGVYEITGVIFFDRMKEESGAAPSGIEIHPILSIEKITYN